jgi:O-antigen/teichoic acid export membrane protein
LGARRQSFLRHALIYGLGTVSVQAAGFLLLPVYTRALTPTEYGTLEVLNRLGELAVLFSLVSCVRQAALTFYGRSPDEAGRQRVLGTTTVLVLVLVLAAGLCLMPLARPVARALGLGAPLLRLAVVAAVLDGATIVLLVAAQARQESLAFVGVSASQFLVRAGCAILFVVGFGWGVEGVLLATLVTGGVHAGWLAVRELTRLRCGPDRARLRDLLAFAVAFLPAGAAFFVLNNGDRFLLLHYAGGNEVGTYALGYKLALAVNLFTRTPLGLVWGARMFEAARSPQAPALFGRVFTRLQGAYVLVGLALCLFQDEAVSLLGGAPYAAAAHVIPVVVLAYFFLNAADLMDGAFYVRGRPGLKTLVALGSATLTGVLYLLLIPAYGALGAAVATLGGFVGHAALTLLVSQRVFRVAYEPRPLLAMLGLAAVLWSVGRWLPAQPWAPAVKGLLWAAWPATLWFAGCVTVEDKDAVRSLPRRALAALRALTGRERNNNVKRSAMRHEDPAEISPRR